MSKQAFSFLTMLAALALPSAALAQAPRELREADVVALAVAQNPALHVALLRAEQGRYDLNAEQALYTPVFDANLGYTHSRTPSLVGPTVATAVTPASPATTRISGADVIDLGAGITKPFATGTLLSASIAGQRSSRTSLEQQALLGASGPGYSLLGRVSATQPLLRGAGTDVGLASYRQAKLSLSADQLAAQKAASDLLAQVVSAYWELWYSAETVRINQASRELSRVQQQQAQQQVASGALAPASALPYATQVAVLEEAVLAAQLDVRQRELALLRLLGRQSELSGSVVAAESPETPTADEPTEAAAVNEALEASYERRELKAQLAILRDQLKVVGEPLRPRLDLDGYLQAQGLGNQRVPPALEQLGRFEAVSAHIGLTFELPLSDVRRSSQIQSALIGAHMLERQLDDNELAIRASVAAAIAERRGAEQRLILVAETEKVAKAQADAERARFQAGGSIAITVQQAEDAYRQAQLRAQRARVDLALADLGLAQARGQLLARYASALQRLPAASRQALTRPNVGNF